MALTKINSHNIQVGAIEASALELSGVTAGSYGSASSVPVITVNQHGLVTGVTTSAVAGVSNVTYANDTLTVSTSSGTNYPVTITQYTDARARAAISATGSLSYNSSTGVISFTQGNTDTVAEGTTNLYYTNARVQTQILAVTPPGGFVGVTQLNSAISTEVTNRNTAISTAIANLVDTAPTTLDTLNELAAALGDDPNFATTITNSIANKVTKIASTDSSIVLFNGTGGELKTAPITVTQDVNETTVKIMGGTSNDDSWINFYDHTGATWFGDIGTNGSQFYIDTNLTELNFWVQSGMPLQLRPDYPILSYGPDSLTRLVTSSAGITVTGSGTATTDWRAPIFYDSNNTAYYLDLANTSTSGLFAGNVGVGTTTPSAKLHVYGTAFPLARIERETTVTNGMRSTFSAIHRTTGDMVDGFGADISFGIRDSAGVDNEIANFGAIRDGADNSGALVFSTVNAGVGQGSIKAILKANGYFGIGTSNPANNLHVESAGNTYVKVRNSSVAKSIFLGAESDSRVGIYAQGDSGQATEFFINNGSETKVDTSGNLFASTSVRAPIFYDSDNTAYYVNPNSTSNLNGLTVGGYAYNNHSSQTWYSTSTYVYDATNGTRYYYIKLGTIGGSCKTLIDYFCKGDNNYPTMVQGRITLSGYNNTSISAVNEVITSDSFGVQLFIDNNNDAWFRFPGSAWNHTLKWRFIYDYDFAKAPEGTKQETQPANSYLINTGYSYKFNRSSASSGPTVTYTPSHVAPVYEARANMRAPIYYDSNDTSYYLDLANTSTSGLFAGKVGIGTTSPSYALHIKNTISGNGTNGTIIIDRTDNISYENALNWATAGTNQWFFGLDNDSTENLYMYHWQGQGSIFKIQSSDGMLVSQKDRRGLTFVKLSTPTVWNATYSGQTDVTINVNTSFGVPSNAKALVLAGYYHVSGYSAGAAGQGDHAMSMFKENNSWSGSSPWSFTTSTDTGWGEYVLEHDGDASGAVHHYGAWANGNGICGVNPNGNIYGRLGWGLSGGTHYNTLWCFGYWI